MSGVLLLVVVWCRVACEDIRDNHNMLCEANRRTMAKSLKQIGEISRYNNGGWKGSPNSIAALLRTRVPIDQQPRCKRCRLPAVKGQAHCRIHLGRWSPLSPAAGRAESRILARLERAGLLPLELIALPVWRGLNGLPTSQRAPTRLALVLAWDKRFAAPVRWVQAQRQAIDQGGLGRQNTAFWYENQ